MSKVDKTMNLDDLIDKFKDYCQGEGDYDELDFKSDLIDWREGGHDAIQALIRTEKLKLLAEVRVRVIGENERGTITNPDIPSYGEQYESTLADKDDLRAELNKLEAEL